MASASPRDVRPAPLPDPRVVGRQFPHVSFHIGVESTMIVRRDPSATQQGERTAPLDDRPICDRGYLDSRVNGSSYYRCRWIFKSLPRKNSSTMARWGDGREESSSARARSAAKTSPRPDNSCPLSPGRIQTFCSKTPAGCSPPVRPRPSVGVHMERLELRLRSTDLPRARDGCGESQPVANPRYPTQNDRLQKQDQDERRTEERQIDSEEHDEHEQADRESGRGEHPGGPQDAGARVAATTGPPS